MTDLLQSAFSDGFYWNDYLLSLLVSLICGLICAFAVSFRNQTSKSFFISLILLPMIVDTVILMVNGNVGTGVAVMGAFSLVRFRSVAGKARDIAIIFLSMTAGLSCGAGFFGYALIFTCCACFVLIILSFVPIGEKNMELRITVPEDLSFSGAFDDVFKAYTAKAQLIKVKTSNMGALYKLSYRVKLKDRTQIRAFLDEIRCRNGNLEVSLLESVEEEGTL